MNDDVSSTNGPRLWYDRDGREIGEEQTAENLRKFVELGGDPNFVYPSTGSSLLHKACHAGSIIVVKELLKLGADLNGMGDVGFAPIFSAVDSVLDMANQDETEPDWNFIRQLLDLGADPEARDENGRDLITFGSQSYGPERGEELVAILAKAGKCAS